MSVDSRTLFKTPIRTPIPGGSVTVLDKVAGGRLGRSRQHAECSHPLTGLARGRGIPFDVQLAQSTVNGIDYPDELLPGCESQPGQAGAQQLQRDPALQTGQRRADTVMDAVAEGEM